MHVSGWAAFGGEGFWRAVQAQKCAVAIPIARATPSAEKLQVLFLQLWAMVCPVSAYFGRRHGGLAPSCLYANLCMHSVQDLNRLFCFRIFWKVARWPGPILPLRQPLYAQRAGPESAILFPHILEPLN